MTGSSTSVTTSRPPGGARILDIINVSSSANTLLRDRVMAMRARGLDNRIVCMPGPYVEVLRQQGIPVHTVRIPRAINVLGMVVATIRMAAYMRRERVDLVHTHCSMPGVLGRVAARLARVPVIVHTVHGFPFHDRVSPWLTRLYIAAEKLCGRITHMLLSQNRTDFEIARRLGIVPPERLRLIGNGINLDHFRPVSRTADPEGRIRILCTARFEPVKNHPMLFGAIRKVRERGRQVRLWLVGEGDLRPEYEGRCAAVGIEDCVEYLGYRDDMPALLAQADIAVLTSIKEGIPRAMLEAMAMRVPVVATRVVGTEETVRDGETGFLVPLDDEEALAGRLIELIDDPSLRARMGARGRAWVESHFDEAAIVEALAAVYRELLRLEERAAPAPVARAAER